MKPKLKAQPNRRKKNESEEAFSFITLHSYSLGVWLYYDKSRDQTTVSTPTQLLLG